MGPTEYARKLRSENHDEEAIPAAGATGTCGRAACTSICDSPSRLCMTRYHVVLCMAVAVACCRLLSLVLAEAVPYS